MGRSGDMWAAQELYHEPTDYSDYASDIYSYDPRHYPEATPMACRDCGDVYPWSGDLRRPEWEDVHLCPGCRDHSRKRRNGDDPALGTLLGYAKDRLYWTRFEARRQRNMTSGWRPPTHLEEGQPAPYPVSYGQAQVTRRRVPIAVAHYVECCEICGYPSRRNLDWEDDEPRDEYYHHQFRHRCSEHARALTSAHAEALERKAERDTGEAIRRLAEGDFDSSGGDRDYWIDRI